MMMYIHIRIAGRGHGQYEMNTSLLVWERSSLFDQIHHPLPPLLLANSSRRTSTDPIPAHSSKSAISISINSAYSDLDTLYKLSKDP